MQGIFGNCHTGLSTSNYRSQQGVTLNIATKGMQSERETCLLFLSSSSMWVIICVPY